MKRGILLFLPICLFAGIDDRLDELEKQMSEIAALTPEGTYGTEMRSANPEVQGLGWFVSGEILYWHAKIGGSDYAISAGGPKSPVLTPIEGTTKENDFGWDLGGRLGIGVFLPHDDWDLLVNFTYYRNHDTSSSHKLDPSYLLSTVGVFGGAFDRAKSTYELSYLNLDLELGRNYFMSQNLSLRPYIGVKASRLHMEQKVKYHFSPLELVGELVGEFYRVHNRSDFDGIGPRVGIKGNWFLGYGFRFFNECSFSLLYSFFEVREKEKASPNASVSNINVHLKADKHSFTPFAQIYSGLGWGGYIYEEKAYLTFKFGYEVLYFWRSNQMLSSDDFTFSGATPFSTRLEYKRYSEDLSFYGITGQVRLDF